MKHFILIFILLTASCNLTLRAQQNEKIKIPVPEFRLPRNNDLQQNKSKIDKLQMKDIAPQQKLPPVVTPIPKYNLRLKQSRFSRGCGHKDFFDSPYYKFAVPAAFITYGVATRSRKSYSELDIKVDSNGNRRSEKVTSIDDYLRYVPYAGIYALDLAGVRAKNSFADRTFVTVLSYFLMEQSVDMMKEKIPTWRPNGGDRRAFPSTHSAKAFVGAHIMFREYKDSSPWLASSGYAFALATASLRMVNRAHSFADVMAGAGIGMLSVELSYLLLPLFQKVAGTKRTDRLNVSLTETGIGLAYKF